MARSDLANLAALVTLGLLTALMLPLADQGRQMGLTPVGYAFAQLGGAGLVLLALARRRGTRLPFSAAHLRYYAVSGVTGLAVPNVTVFMLVERVGPSMVALLYTLPPVITYALALSVGQERWHPLRGAGLVLGLAAGAVLVTRGGGGLSGQGAPWMALGLLVPLSLATGNVYRSAAWPPDTDRLALAAGMLLGGAASLLPVLGLLGGWGAVPAPGVLGPILAAQVAATALTYPVFFALQQRGGPVYISHLGLTIAVAGVLIGALFYGERPGPVVWLAAIAAAAGTVLANRRPGRRKT
ncbi:MAG: DMT family transporter [Paracoccaceae bacterium]